MNVLLKGREVSFYLTDPGAKHLFAWHDFAAAAARRALRGRRRGRSSSTPGEFEALLGDATALAENVAARRTRTPR